MYNFLFDKTLLKKKIITYFSIPETEQGAGSINGGIRIDIYPLYTLCIYKKDN